MVQNNIGPTEEEIDEGFRDFREMTREDQISEWLQERFVESSHTLSEVLGLYFTYPEHMKENTETVAGVVSAIVEGLFILGYETKERGWRIGK